MHIIAPVSNHRLARRFRWAGLWLGWLASLVAFLRTHTLLSKQVKAVVQHWLDQAAKLIACYIYLAAEKRLPPLKQRRRAGPPRKRIGFSLRAHFGARLRRALRHRDIDQRIELLRAVARNPESLVRALTRRLRNGLTRLRRLWTAGALAGTTFSVARADAGEAPALHMALDSS